MTGDIFGQHAWSTDIEQSAWHPRPYQRRRLGARRRSIIRASTQRQHCLRFYIARRVVHTRKSVKISIMTICLLLRHKRAVCCAHEIALYLCQLPRILKQVDYTMHIYLLATMPSPTSSEEDVQRNKWYEHTKKIEPRR